MKQLFLRSLKRFDFAILTLCLVCFHLPYFNPLFIPRHDTRSIFELFHFFYNEFFFNGQLAQWMPYYSYGIPSSYFQFYALTPSSYFLFFIGWLFKITDVLWLFKISVLGEYLILLLGMYLLSRQLFSSRKTAFFICLGSLCASDYWYFQLFFSSRIFYMFPLAAYFLILLFRYRRPLYLWLSGIVVMAWMSGNPQYFVVLWAFILFVLGFIFLMKDKSIWRCLFEKSISNVFLGIILFAIVGAYFYQLVDMTSFARIASRSSKGSNSLGLFLTYGGNIGYLKEFFIKHIFANDSEGYIGLFPLIFFVWAFLKVRSRAYCAFLSATLILMGISFGGIFAAIFYFFPGLSYYRHIGHVYGFIKILFLLTSGFGLDHFWSAPAKTKIVLIPIILGILIILSDCLGISGEKLAAWSLSDSPIKTFLENMQIGGLAFRLVIYFVGYIVILLTVVRIKRDKNFKWQIFYKEKECVFVSIVAVCCLIDIFSFQYFLYKNMKKFSSPLSYVTKTNQLQFQVQRLKEPENSRARDALNFAAGAGGISYAVVYSFAQFDPCQSEFRVDFFPLRLERLFATRKDSGHDLFDVLGCDAPKLRLLSSAVSTNTLDEAMQMMEKSPAIFDKAILRSVDQDLSRPSSANSLEPSGGKVMVKKFSANELIADVDIPMEEGAWLVYADSFHPGWHAFVNKQKTPIHEAYLAFKAVHLEKGSNAVRFVFHNGLGSIISYFIAFFGFIMAGALFVMILIMVFCNGNFFVKNKMSKEFYA